MVTPGEVLEKQGKKQKALAQLIERNRAELSALHPEAGPFWKSWKATRRSFGTTKPVWSSAAAFYLGMQLAFRGSDKPAGTI